MRETHGESRSTGWTSEYTAWKNMKSRCYYEGNCKYPIYGGRGIRVCRKWKQSYLMFIRDMGRRPSKLHSLDRINNDGNYEPSNCRWATLTEQAYNRRFTERKRNINGTFAAKEYK